MNKTPVAAHVIQQQVSIDAIHLKQLFSHSQCKSKMAVIHTVIAPKEQK